jgi:hypothetical protein
MACWCVTSWHACVRGKARFWGSQFLSALSPSTAQLSYLTAPAARMSNQDTAPFFGFIGAASALVFSCGWPKHCGQAKGGAADRGSRSQLCSDCPGWLHAALLSSLLFWALIPPGSVRRAVVASPAHAAPVSLAELQAWALLTALPSLVRSNGTGSVGRERVEEDDDCYLVDRAPRPARRQNSP